MSSITATHYNNQNLRCATDGCGQCGNSLVSSTCWISCGDFPSEAPTPPPAPPPPPPSPKPEEPQPKKSTSDEVEGADQDAAGGGVDAGEKEGWKFWEWWKNHGPGRALNASSAVAPGKIIQPGSLLLHLSLSLCVLFPSVYVSPPTSPSLYCCLSVPQSDKPSLDCVCSVHRNPNPKPRTPNP